MFEVELNAPLNVEWEITSACNLRCRHCYVSAGARLPEELTTEEALKLIGELDEIGISDITLSGGEPFLRKDIWLIIDELHKRQIPFTIYTNATLLDAEVVEKLVNRKVKSISVSLNGATAETHNFVQNASTFNLVLKAIKLLKENNIKVQVLFTLMKINAKETDDLIKLTRELDVDSLCIYPFYPAGRGRENLQYLELDAKIARDILTEAVQKNNGKPPTIYVGGCLSRHFSPTKKHSLIKGAPCAKLMALVTADGHLRPCNFLPFRTRHGVKEKKIAELWNEPLFENIRDWNKSAPPECSNCEHIHLCFSSCLSMHLDMLDSNFKATLESLADK
ncbi:MAG: radical SAM protein [Candidatus Bathyarchaeia archaeon]